MNRSSDWLSQWIYYLASSLYFGAVFLRSLILYQDSPVLGRVLGLLLVWMVLSASETFISRKWAAYFPLYLVLQTVLVFILLKTPGSPDFFAALLSILSMQVMRRLDPRIGMLWIILSALITGLLLAEVYQNETVALVLIYTAGTIFFGAYSLAIRRAQAARLKNQELGRDLEQANLQLQELSSQLGQLAVARERNRLARDLHDSVTQTVFSMTLSTQSARLLLDRDPPQANTQLERLNELARSALSEMQVLISELKPGAATPQGLASALRRHLAGSRFPENLSISLDVDADQPLEPAEEQALLRIAQEALNNIVKHAQASQVHIRLHLAEPRWMEIEDDGAGFDLPQARRSGRVGLASMQERAAEIGWSLQIISSPGAGACIRVEKTPVVEVQT